MSQVDHAVSANVSGPYKKVDTALPAQATNPQAIVDAAGTWWLFHIGDAQGKSGKNCTHTAAPAAGVGGAGASAQPGTLQKAPGPAGPWTAVPLPFGCNNPAPGIVRLCRCLADRVRGLRTRLTVAITLQANDGSYVLLVCTWSVHKATSFAGPWSSALLINPTPVPLDPVAHWEVRQRRPQAQSA